MKIKFGMKIWEQKTVNHRPYPAGRTSPKANCVVAVGVEAVILGGDFSFGYGSPETRA